MYDYTWEEKHRLVVKGFTTKGELKEAARDHTKASIYLETLNGGDPADGVYEARPLNGRWIAKVWIRGGCIRSAK